MNSHAPPWLDPLTVVASVALFAIGLFCTLTQHNPIKQVIGLKILLQGVTLSLISAAQLYDQTALGETMIVSALVIEAVTIAVALALIVNLYRHYPSGDIDDMNRLRG